MVQKEIPKLNIPFYSTRDIPRNLIADYLKIFKKILEEDNLIDGRACTNFESKFGDYLEVSHVIGVGNGFDAINIGLLALGIGAGDRVAVPAHTFVATWFAVLSTGATPIGVDVDSYGQIDLNALEKIDNLKCVIPVHMHGTHCDMRRLASWAKQKSVYVIEDCAQAAGLKIQGRLAGTWGDVGAFSFYPTKNLFALGDGGAIVTDNFDLANLARSISRYGSSRDNKYEHIRLGKNSRLDSVQAGILEYNLCFLDKWNDTRKKIAETYDNALKAYALPRPPASNHVFHHYVLSGLSNRDFLRQKMLQAGIATEIHYPRVAADEAQSELQKNYPNAKAIASTSISIPISPWQTQSTTDYVLEVVESLLNES